MGSLFNQGHFSENVFLGEFGQAVPLFGRGLFFNDIDLSFQNHEEIIGKISLVDNVIARIELDLTHQGDKFAHLPFRKPPEKSAPLEEPDCFHANFRHVSTITMKTDLGKSDTLSSRGQRDTKLLRISP